MASIVSGARRHRAALDQPLINSQVVVKTDAIRDVQVTAAEHAIAGGWESQLGEVLDRIHEDRSLARSGPR